MSSTRRLATRVVAISLCGTALFLAGAPAHAQNSPTHAAKAKPATVGVPAPPLVGDTWFNAPAGTTRVTFGDGHVYLVEFTAHWCVPCRMSYAPLDSIVAYYQSRNVHLLYTTRLYGYFGTAQELAPAVELDSLKHYLAEHHITAPMSVATHLSADAKSPNAAAYGVDGMPTVLLIDGEGMIRGRWTGWGDIYANQIRRELARVLGDSAEVKRLGNLPQTEASVEFGRPDIPVPVLTMDMLAPVIATHASLQAVAKGDTQLMMQGGLMIPVTPDSLAHTIRANPKLLGAIDTTKITPERYALLLYAVTQAQATAILMPKLMPGAKSDPNSADGKNQAFYLAHAKELDVLTPAAMRKTLDLPEE